VSGVAGACIRSRGGGAPGKRIGHSSRYKASQRHAFVYFAIPRNRGNHSSGYGSGGRQEQECHRRQSRRT
jgi:hypothetical protein